MMDIGTRVRLVGARNGVGTIREFVEPKPGLRRARVFWHTDKCEQFVDVSKLEAATDARPARDTSTRRALAAKLHAEGLSTADAAERMGVSRGTVVKLWRDQGLSRRGTREGW